MCKRKDERHDAALAMNNARKNCSETSQLPSKNRLENQNGKQNEEAPINQPNQTKFFYSDSKPFVQTHFRIGKY